MQHPTSLRLYDYWTRRLVETATPGGIAPFAAGAPLGDLFLLGLEDGAPLRFCGAAVAARYGGASVSGRFLALWSDGDRRRIERGLGLMAADGVGLLARIAGETAGGGFTDFEMVLLPVRGARGCDRALGSLVRIGGHDDRQPIRARLVAQSLRTVRLLRPRRPGFPRPAPADAPPPAPAAGNRSRRGHLTVICGGR